MCYFSAARTTLIIFHNIFYIIVSLIYPMEIKLLFLLSYTISAYCSARLSTYFFYLCYSFYLDRRSGGEKIYYVFDNQFPVALKRLQFEKHLTMENVKKLITQADGYQPHLIAPEQGYRRLIESCLGSIKGPAEAAVDAVCCAYMLICSIIRILICFLHRLLQLSNYFEMLQNLCPKIEFTF
jgi:hypothetical protein